MFIVMLTITLMVKIIYNHQYSVCRLILAVKQSDRLAGKNHKFLSSVTLTLRTSNSHWIA